MCKRSENTIPSPICVVARYVYGSSARRPACFFRGQRPENQALEYVRVFTMTKVTQSREFLNQRIARRPRLDTRRAPCAGNHVQKRFTCVKVNRGQWTASCLVEYYIGHHYIILPSYFRYWIDKFEI